MADLRADRYCYPVVGVVGRWRHTALSPFDGESFGASDGIGIGLCCFLDRSGYRLQ